MEGKIIYNYFFIDIGLIWFGSVAREMAFPMIPASAPSLVETSRSDNFERLCVLWCLRENGEKNLIYTILCKCYSLAIRKDPTTTDGQGRQTPIPDPSEMMTN